MQPPAPLIARIAAQNQQPQQPELEALSASLRQRYGDTVVGLLYYGSCLRGGDPRDGLVDLYVVVDSYRAAHRSLLSAGFNQLLPPNVYYLEAPVEGEPVRAKYAVVSLAQLRRGCSTAWFQTYLWGRFAQPTGLLYARDAAAAAAIQRCLASAVLTFLSRTIPALPARLDALALWEQGLALSYRTELRAEKKGRGKQIVGFYQDYYQSVTATALLALPFPASKLGAHQYQFDATPRSRRIAPLSWALRRIQGKLLSIARLVKAVFTFAGGVDYIVWKLERHSGQRIEVDDKVRRHPLIHGWGLMWRLYRRGVFS
jgi:hypothetical protein